MVQEFHVTRCVTCENFQVQQVKENHTLFFKLTVPSYTQYIVHKQTQTSVLQQQSPKTKMLVKNNIQL